jgi:hypothetical protein
VKRFRSSGQGVTALALGLVLASYAHEDGTGIRVSPDALASMLGCSSRTVRRRLRHLTKAGWLRPALIEGTESLRLAVPTK